MDILSIYYDIRILISINCINIYLINPHEILTAFNSHLSLETVAQNREASNLKSQSWSFF